MHLPREKNQMANVLATLALTWEIEKHAEMKPLILMRSRTPCYNEIRVMPINPTKKSWFYDLQQYLETGQFLEDVEKKERMSLRMLSRQFLSYNGILYRRASTGVHLKCVDKNEAHQLRGYMIRI